jgi:hypothetical protein
MTCGNFQSFGWLEVQFASSECHIIDVALRGLSLPNGRRSAMVYAPSGHGGLFGIGCDGVPLGGYSCVSAAISLPLLFRINPSIY